VIKSTPGALNDTLAVIEHNVKLVSKELSDIQTYLDTLSSVTARKLDIFETKFMINTTPKLTMLLRSCRGLQIWYWIVFSARSEGAYNQEFCHLNYFRNP